MFGRVFSDNRLLKEADAVSLIGVIVVNKTGVTIEFVLLVPAWDIVTLLDSVPSTVVVAIGISFNNLSIIVVVSGDGSACKVWAVSVVLISFPENGSLAKVWFKLWKRICENDK